MTKDSYFILKIFIIGLFGVMSLLLSDFQTSIELPQEIISQFSSSQIIIPLFNYGVWTLLITTESTKSKRLITLDLLECQKSQAI